MGNGWMEGGEQQRVEGGCNGSNFKMRSLVVFGRGKTSLGNAV